MIKINDKYAVDIDSAKMNHLLYEWTPEKETTCPKGIKRLREAHWKHTGYYFKDVPSAVKYAMKLETDNLVASIDNEVELKEYVELLRKVYDDLIESVLKTMGRK